MVEIYRLYVCVNFIGLFRIFCYRMCIVLAYKGIKQVGLRVQLITWWD